MNVAFNKPYMTGKELVYIAQAHANNHLAGDGEFTKKCNAWLEQRVGCHKALLTHSCTGALEMAAILADIQPGDEVIMPSYTFVSTANAFVLRGGIPVFVDIRPDTLNIDETKIEAAITARTKAIVPVHYAGVACEMDTIMDIAQRHDLLVIEDAAQGSMSTYKGRALGSIGHMGCLSFHETKNIISGEGGALLINDSRFAERAEIIREKGTNRSQFFRGQVDKYTWVDIGSSYLPSEIIAAFLYAQLEQADEIIEKRRSLHKRYIDKFQSLAQKGCISLSANYDNYSCNGHMFYLLAKSREERDRLIRFLGDNGVNAVFHYVPLHSSLAGKRFGRIGSIMKVTNDVSDRLLRLPLFYEITYDEVDFVVDLVIKFYETNTKCLGS